VNASRDTPRYQCAELKPSVASGTQSVPDGIPTRSVGTINGSVRAYVQEVQPNEVFRVGERVRISTVGGTSRVSH